VKLLAFSIFVIASERGILEKVIEIFLSVFCAEIKRAKKNTVKIVDILFNFIHL
jgi:hypothetical protein